MNLKHAKVVPLIEQTQVAVQNASIVSISGKDAVIRISGITYKARVAFSCIIQPIPDDLVMCTKNETGEYYILGIIERPGAQNMTLSFPADATMISEDGALSMFSGKSITLASAGGLNCISEKVVHKSREAVVDYDELIARGTNLQASFKSVLLVSRVINTIARQIVERAKNYIRRTEDFDQVNAGQMTRKADGLYSMNSKHTVMISKKDTKIDGERIHMG